MCLSCYLKGDNVCNLLLYARLLPIHTENNNSVFMFHSQTTNLLINYSHSKFLNRSVAVLYKFVFFFNVNNQNVLKQSFMAVRHFIMCKDLLVYIWHISMSVPFTMTKVHTIKKNNNLTCSELNFRYDIYIHDLLNSLLYAS